MKSCVVCNDKNYEFYIIEFQYNKNFRWLKMMDIGVCEKCINKFGNTRFRLWDKKERDNFNLICEAMI